MTRAPETAPPSQEADGVLGDLRRSFDDLTQSQKRIAEAIVRDPEFVAFATVDRFAARLGLSPSTIVRFAYRIGLNGYQDLQGRVRDIVRSQLRSAQGVDPSREASPAAHLRDSAYGASLEHDLLNLQRTLALLSEADLDRAVDALVGADTVFVAGGHASSSLAEYAVLALDRTHGRTVRVAPDGKAALRLADMAAGDVLLALSFPPYAMATLKVVEHARAHGVRTIAITDSPISPIGQRVDLVLSAHVSGVGLQNSLVAPMVIVNALLNAVAVRLPDAVARHQQVMRLMGQWNDFVLRDDE